MPIYEYKCKKCGDKFEKRVGFFQDKKALRCPVCGSEDTERVFSPFATESTKNSSCAPRPFKFG